MDIKQLRCFAAAAELENFTSASAQLRIAQSALSRHISNLEFELGTELFERTGRGVRLSSKGRQVYEYARKLLAEFDAFHEAVKPQQTTELSGNFTFGILGSLSSALSALIVEKIAAAHPKVSLTIIEGLTGDIEAQIAAKRIDFGLVLDLGETAGVVRSLVVIDSAVLISARTAARLPHSPSCLSEVLTFPLVFASGDSREREHTQALAAGLGLPLNVASESNAFGSEMALVRAGRGHLLTTEITVAGLRNIDDWVVTRVSDLEIGINLARRQGPASDAIGRICALVRDVVLEARGALRPHAD